MRTYKKIQISHLLITNLFIGAMLGLERTNLPLMADSIFNLESQAVVFSFILSFGLSKAIINLFAGHWADRLGRKPLLISGWIIAIPIPFIFIYAPSWNWIIFANVLMGISQSLAWSMTVIMKIDLVKKKKRGLVIGLNEFTGYMGIALMAYISSLLANHYGLHPIPFYSGFALIAAGLILSLLSKETLKNKYRKQPKQPLVKLLLKKRLLNRAIFSIHFAGLCTNLKDAILWGLLPIYLAQQQLSWQQIGGVAALYPLVWAGGQLIFGPLSDRYGRKSFICLGLVLQAVGVSLFLLQQSIAYSAYAASLITGAGTAMAYPTLLAAISDKSKKKWRASALGLYRFWRDLGYAIGACIAYYLLLKLSIEWLFIVTIALLFFAFLCVYYLFFDKKMPSEYKRVSNNLVLPTLKTAKNGIVESKK